MRQDQTTSSPEGWAEGFGISPKNSVKGCKRRD